MQNVNAGNIVGTAFRNSENPSMCDRIINFYYKSDMITIGSNVEMLHVGSADKYKLQEALMLAEIAQSKLEFSDANTIKANRSVVKFLHAYISEVYPDYKQLYEEAKTFTDNVLVVNKELNHMVVFKDGTINALEQELMAAKTAIVLLKRRLKRA